MGDLSADADFDVALVLVHGIGQQLSGETLVEWSDPIAARLAAILQAAGSPGAVRIQSARLLADDRSCVVLSATLPDAASISVRITEARWADSFLTQKPTTVLGWAAKFVWRATGRTLRHLAAMRLPIVTRGLKHWSRTIESWFRDETVAVAEVEYQKGIVADRSEKAKRANDGAAPDISTWAAFASLLSAGSIIQAVLGGILILALGVALAVAVVVGASIAAWTIPVLATAGVLLLALLLRVPVIGKRLSPIAVSLSTSIGDASVLSSSSVNAAAMRAVVQDAVEDAASRARRVILVGHSQGAALCALSLFGVDDPAHHKVDTLVTIGGANTLLKPAREGGASDVTDLLRVWATESAVRWINIWAFWDPVASGPIVGSDADAIERWEELRNSRKLMSRVSLRSRRNRRERMSLRLNNLDGPASKVSQSLPGPIGPEERPVSNLSSIISDHVSYSVNILQVIDPIARLILGPSHEAEARDESHRTRLRFYQCAVRELGFGRLLTAVIALALTPLAVSFAVSAGALSAAQENIVQLSGSGSVAGWVLSLAFSAPVSFSLAWILLFLLLRIPQAVLWPSYKRSTEHGALDGRLVWRRLLFNLPTYASVTFLTVFVAWLFFEPGMAAVLILGAMFAPLTLWITKEILAAPPKLMNIPARRKRMPRGRQHLLDPRRSSVHAPKG